jgi:hypothetical protein
LQLALLWLEVLTLDGAKRIRLGGDLVLNLTDLKPVLQLKEKRWANAFTVKFCCRRHTRALSIRQSLHGQTAPCQVRERCPGSAYRLPPTGVAPVFNPSSPQTTPLLYVFLIHMLHLSFRKPERINAGHDVDAILQST